MQEIKKRAKIKQGNETLSREQVESFQQFVLLYFGLLIKVSQFVTDQLGNSTVISDSFFQDKNQLDKLLKENNIRDRIEFIKDKGFRFKENVLFEGNDKDLITLMQEKQATDQSIQFNQDFITQLSELIGEVHECMSKLPARPLDSQLVNIFYGDSLFISNFRSISRVNTLFPIARGMVVHFIGNNSNELSEEQKQITNLPGLLTIVGSLFPRIDDYIKASIDNKRNNSKEKRNLFSSIRDFFESFDLAYLKNKKGIQLIDDINKNFKSDIKELREAYQKMGAKASGKIVIRASRPPLSTISSGDVSASKQNETTSIGNGKEVQHSRQEVSNENDEEVNGSTEPASVINEQNSGGGDENKKSNPPSKIELGLLLLMFTIPVFGQAFMAGWFLAAALDRKSYQGDKGFFRNVFGMFGSETENENPTGSNNSGGIINIADGRRDEHGENERYVDSGKRDNTKGKEKDADERLKSGRESPPPETVVWQNSNKHTVFSLNTAHKKDSLDMPKESKTLVRAT